MIYDQIQVEIPTSTAVPQQPTVLTHVAGILTELNANLLISKLYEQDLGRHLQPHHVQTVVDFVAGLEARDLPGEEMAAQPAQDGATAQPVT